MFSVIGGLAVMLGSSPLAAQTGASVSRSLDPLTVAPGGEVTVTITADDFGVVGGELTETLPAGFTYVSSNLDDSQVESAGQDVTFFLFATDNIITYTVTASDMASASPAVFSGTLTYRDDDEVSQELTVGGDTDITVGVDVTPGVTPGPTPDPTVVDADYRKFDVVPAKAVKGAVVSGLKNPIGSNPLQWEVETGGAAATIAGGGLVGEDFRIVETSEGSGEFQLLVEKSDVPSLSVTQAISVDVTYEVDGADVTETLSGDITERNKLAFTNGPFGFTISQGISDGTPIGDFKVAGRVAGEYLDGIVSGDDAAPFEVRDSDMTLVYKGGSLEVKEHSFDLTVNGDAGMANRAIIRSLWR